MSRIGKNPIELPAGVTVTIEDGTVQVSGPLGTLRRAIRPEMEVSVQGTRLGVKPAAAGRKISAYWGLTRSLIAQMVEGVSRGFSKKLELEGIGYRAIMDGPSLQLSLGFSHPVRVEPPPGITFKVERNVITVSGPDAVLVGDVASRIRKFRPPEPYKGKGIRYVGEVIRRKAGKKAVSAAS